MSREQIAIRHQVEAVLAAAADEVEVRQAAFFEDPDDPETIHKLRVSIRSLRSLIGMLAPWQKRKQNKTADRCLGNVVRKTSRLRELDVLEAQVRAMTPAAADDLIAICETSAAEERNYVLSEFRRKETQEVLFCARCATRAIDWQSAIAREGLTLEAIQKHFNELAEAQKMRYAALDRADAEATHTVRKRAKEVRYIATRFRDLLTPEAIDLSKCMKDVQDELGALCDARVNVELLSGIPTEGLSVRARRNLAEALAENYAFIEQALGYNGSDENSQLLDVPAIDTFG